MVVAVAAKAAVGDPVPAGGSTAYCIYEEARHRHWCKHWPLELYIIHSSTSTQTRAVQICKTRIGHCQWFRLQADNIKKLPNDITWLTGSTPLLPC
jgi:hypothetical protein